MTNRERLSGVDNAWLRMEHPTNLMMIVGVMMLERHLPLATLRRTLAARLLAWRRFRQRAVQEVSGTWWEDDPEFDIARHVTSVRLPGRHGKEELEALVSELASTPLDMAHPLWEYRLVENYGAGSAIVIRIHHAYADGMALIQVMLSLTGETPRESVAARPRPAAAPPGGDADGDFWEQLLRPLAAVLDGAAEAGKGLLHQGVEMASSPQAAGDALQSLARKGLDFAAEVARLATMGPDAPTRFKGPLGTRKRAAWATPLPLDEVKVVGKALGCSINDVLLSMAAGALRDYLRDRGDPVDGLEIRAVVPVNLRPPGEVRELGNRFGLVFLQLPLGMDHPLERLYEVRRRMQQLKGSYQPVIALGLLNAVGYGPRALQEQVAALLGSSASAVMTNVPGPRNALYFAGKRIVEMDFWVPQSGGIGLGVSILSYDGRIQFGLVSDAGLVPDPARIVERFGDEFEKLLWITLMSPWGPDADAAPSPRAPRVPKRFRTP